MAKTGSTSIQATLAVVENRPEFHYLHSGEANVGRAFATAFMAQPNSFRPNRKLGLSDEVMQRGKKKILEDFSRQLDGPQDLVVASSEMLGNFDPESLCALYEWLNQRVDAIRLIGYVREPAGFIESMFQQSLKNGNSDFKLSKRYPAYRQRFEKLENAFGRQRVEYRMFAPATFPSRCVVRDFLGAIGLDLPETSIVRINESLSREAVGLLYAYRQHHPEFAAGQHAVRRNRQLIQSLATLTGDKLRIHPRLLRDVIESQTADLNWISERLGQPLTPVYPAAGSSVIQAERDLLTYSDATIEWLNRLTGGKLIQVSGRPYPYDSAKLAGALDAYLDQHEDTKLPEEPPVVKEETETRRKVHINTLIDSVRDSCPGVALDHAEYRDLVRAALVRLVETIDKHPSGMELTGLDEFENLKWCKKEGGRGRNARIQIKRAGRNVKPTSQS